MKTLLLIIVLASTATGQWRWVVDTPQLAPHDCPCQPECKCNPCVCKTQTKPVVSVKKVYSPQEASVTVQATKGKEAFRGSGTAIDTNLVLTCWHITRGSDWTYTINGKPAKLLRSDSKSDVALFSTEETLKPVNVANEPLRAGEPCTAWGYEWNRKGLWKFPANVVQVMRYRGFPNVSTRGRDPVQSGRSGGGLFNSKGELVGVCSARDGVDGLYCGLDAIKAILNPSQDFPSWKCDQTRKPDAAKTTPFFLQDCPDGQFVKPDVVTPYKSNMGYSHVWNCPSGQCFPQIAPKAIVPKPSTPPKQAPSASSPVNVKPKAGVSPGLPGLCPNGQCGPSNAPVRRWGRR